MSGHVAKGTSNPARLPEDIGLLRKPFTKHELAQRVRAVLDEYAERFGASSTNAVEAMADGVGFEPTRRSSRLPVFKTGALNRSATHPISNISIS